MSTSYVVRPKADADLDEHAFYLGSLASPETGHRFLVAAHRTFALLATRPAIGWQPRARSKELRTLRVFRVSGFENMLVLYQPRPQGVEILRVVHASRDLTRLVRREGIR